MKEITSHPWLNDVIDQEKETNILTELKSKMIQRAIIDEIAKIEYPKLIGKNESNLLFVI